MPAPVSLTPIGVVRSVIVQPVDDVWGGTTAHIDLDAARFTSDSLIGLDEFSHVEVLFFFDRIPAAREYGARHPRNRPAWPLTGIFAQRARNRPNQIGSTVCRLLSVHDLSIEVEQLDAIDGTPVLDIKPYIAEFGPRGTVRQPPWASELMSGYWNCAETPQDQA